MAGLWDTVPAICSGLTVTVITRNEAANIAAALESVRWADEIVVVDSESTDDTVEPSRSGLRTG